MIDEACALAVAARGLLRAGLAEDAKPIVERLAGLLERARGPVADVIPIGRGK